ncbi:putative DNA-directed RNA polymerase I subunit [Trypanosoma cruzi]|uniref:DNA-directed RNA polymerase, putative n=2 Tax=Trypanosoma cruzi TaxID=5693 RepID=Q4DDP9_TRYCC|nr:DNA-directed RNA polymerase, putative [Trypanosoma cruzi]EAN90661.1 DNA-directed RNA polymerase, putative [Trypanosoma cruzi]KAF8281569.1 putative DNA-directed RNA polymerase [Trypanosoma cruzi]PWU97608.1 putative DNA-directed RNA polymerase I subunit [Trypanosoma cruzi]RNC60343.1 DNA-directed RNA polymerase [Trypanosoma cruzi]|eukprot:XP_812512.1 DNA-directed RNA polymerase [Trypanosoma cruzi strain CL Brener]
MSASTTARFLSMGSMYCAVCGAWMPQQKSLTSPPPVMWCQQCGTYHQQNNNNNSGDGVYETSTGSASNNTAAALLFTPKEVRAAQAEVMMARAKAGTTVGTAVGSTHVDNRVLEEAFCGTCGVHRQCKVFARQIRSADEGQTIFYQCITCNAEWQLNS